LDSARAILLARLDEDLERSRIVELPQGGGRCRAHEGARVVTEHADDEVLLVPVRRATESAQRCGADELGAILTRLDEGLPGSLASRLAEGEEKPQPDARVLGFPIDVRDRFGSTCNLRARQDLSNNETRRLAFAQPR